MKRITILTSWIDGESVRSRFKKRGRGARRWMYIADGFREVVAEIADEAQRPQPILEDGKTLGRGATIAVPVDLFPAVRRRFRKLDEVRKAKAAEEFEWRMDQGVRELVRQDRENRKKATTSKRTTSVWTGPKRKMLASDLTAE